MKKILLSIGTISAVIAPVVFAVSCNNKQEEPDKLNENFVADAQVATVSDLASLKTSVTSRLDAISDMFDNIKEKNATYALFKNRDNNTSNDNYYYISIGSIFNGIDPAKVNQIQAELKTLNTALAKFNNLKIFDQPIDVFGAIQNNAITLSDKGSPNVHFQAKNMEIFKSTNSAGEQFIMRSGLILDTSRQDVFVKASDIEKFGLAKFEQVNICLEDDKTPTTVKNIEELIQAIDTAKNNIDAIN